MAQFKAAAAIACLALVGALLYAATGTRTPEVDEDNAQAPAPAIATTDLSEAEIGNETLPEATPQSESIPVAEWPPNHPPVTRYSKNIPLEEVARQEAAREAEKQAYVDMVAVEHWLESLAKLSEERLPTFFARVGSTTDSMSYNSADTLSDLAKDPRVAKLLEIAAGDDQALRFELYQHVEKALGDWALRFERQTDTAYSVVPNGALALPLLYYVSGDDSYAVAETLAQLVAARQATLRVLASNYTHDVPVTSDYVLDRFSNISSDVIRLSLRSLSENNDFLRIAGPESRAILEDFRQFQAAVAQSQQGRMQSLSDFFGSAATEKFADPYYVDLIDLIDFANTGGNSRIASLDLHFLDRELRLSVWEIPIHYFELLAMHAQ